jgi:hypothetical protein
MPDRDNANAPNKSVEQKQRKQQTEILWMNYQKYRKRKDCPDGIDRKRCSWGIQVYQPYQSPEDDGNDAISNDNPGNKLEVPATP